MIKGHKILFIIALFSKSLFSQLYVKNYFSFTGKKDVSVNVVVQDKNGFLWLGTNEGVYKFDGKTSSQIAKGSSIFKQPITTIYIDEKHKAWIGTKSGKVFTFFGNKIDSVNFLTANEDKITSICEIDSAICISTYGNGIFIYSKAKATHITSENGLSDDVVYKIVSNTKNTIWCATDGGFTEIKNVLSKPSYKIISNKVGLPDNIVRDISIEKSKLMISMQDSGVCYYDINESKLERVSFFANWTLGAIVNASTQVPNNTIVGTERNGLLQLKDGVISIYDYEKYLQTSSINQMFIDRSKQIWIASRKGISQFFERRYDFINASRGLEDDKILAIATDNDQAIWVGTNKGVSKLMMDEKGKLVISKILEGTKYTLSCATIGPEGSVWFGTYGNGISIFNPSTKGITNITSKTSSLPNDNISNIYFADDKTAYISTLGGGLIKAEVNVDIDKFNFKINEIYTEDEGLGSNYVYAAITDSNSKLYIATDGGGLQTYQNNKFISLTEKFKIKSNTIISLCKDEFNSIWASSNANGILKYDGKTIISIGLNEGLRDEQPVQLISSHGTVFSINSKGIDKIDCINNSISYYDLFDGDLEPSLNAVFLCGDKIYSGTNNGILIYRTSKIALDSVKPKVFIKALQINYKPFPIDSVSEFNHSQNNLAFTFDGIWLKNPDKLSYRFRLEGQDEDWLYATESKLVNYNNLTAGSYTFVVQSKNEEDVWSEPATFSFVILLPIWKKWWFWLIVIIIVASALYSFLKYRLKALQKENLILEEKVALRTQEIEKQSEIIAEANKELEQLSIVASRTDNVVLILKPNGDIEYVNESFSKLNRISLEEILEQKLNIFTSSNNSRIKDIVSEAIATKKSIKYESYNQKNPDNSVWEASTLTPIFDENDNIKKIIIIDSDITESKRQQKIIEQKNKDILDSISYARKIQHAILPELSVIKQSIPNSFVLYMTKDIVSGDFYWFTHIDNCSIIAAIDCTGHGVPGAFMSLIGYNLLNKVVNEQKIVNPKDILFELNKGVLEALYKNESESKDGMDVAICKINHEDGTVDYAGAMRPIWIVNNKSITEIKADKIPIGTKQQDREDKIAFTTHTLKVNKGDSFYIFTDGYADQFGGPKDKKYSTGKFKELIIENSELDFATQEQKLKEAHLSWKSDNEQVDDILVIGFKI
ncbi:MAG: two-component regulator propeller domain-containing protein [Bacteroidota bacterium]|nr:two-component regulator propeller domain-containing protein [Bacteroidota bacterium]MDP3145083.1 two-component regulator propeller domain-containing protein [Bacteroidota bacterium]